MRLCGSSAGPAGPRTSFATPTVAAAIARRFIEAGGTPMGAYADLISGVTPVAVSDLTDAALTGTPVTKPNLHLP